MSKIKSFFKKFLLINDSPHRVAAGAAVGIFLGMIPGEGVLATIFFSTIFRLNRLAALAGVVAANMWTTFIILPPAAWLGGKIFGANYFALVVEFEKNHSLEWKYFINKAFIFDVALPLMTGFVLVAGIIAIAFYFIVYYLLETRRMELAKKLKEKLLK